MDGSNDQRRAALHALEATAFDILIIGGGITGAGIARDASARGLKVGLIEKNDFASGTSSKSSKLIHGGLRYLEQAELKLVFESVNERKQLMKVARHLVRPKPFLVTNYVGDRHVLPTLDLGLWIYEALCLFGTYRRHRTFGARKTLELEPSLRPEGLRGGILYYDCFTDDARLTLETLIDAKSLGATVVNYVKAGALIHEGGHVAGVELVDLESKAALRAKARVVINATGPWSDEVRAMLGRAPLLKPTKGVHVVVDAKRLPIHFTHMVTSPRDRRALFCIPWGLGRTVIGTTDTFFDGNLDHVDATRADVEYLLETANSFFPGSRLTANDVLATWGGLRPLLAPADATTGASQVSREHLIEERAGFITIAGGKLTTFRRMAAEVVDRALVQLNVTADYAPDERPLPGAVGLTESDDALDQVTNELVARNFALDSAEYLSSTYGVRARSIITRIAKDSSAKTPLDPELPLFMAQVDEAVENELARTVTDVLARRLPVLLKARDQGLAIAPAVAARVRSLLSLSDVETERQLAEYRTVVDASRRFRE